MRTTQHTHRGNCQACGALQAMARGGQPLALHGYVVAGWGFFNGVCPGSRKLPLQLDRTYADEIIESLRLRAVRAGEWAAALRAGTATPEFAHTGKCVKNERGKWVDETVAYADADEYHQRRAVTDGIWSAEQDVRHSTSHADHLNRLGDRAARHSAGAREAEDSPCRAGVGHALPPVRSRVGNHGRVRRAQGMVRADRSGQHDSPRYGY